MKILVIDVAAEHGGALSILKDFIARFKADAENEYVVCVSTLDFEDAENVKFIKTPWVKKSKLHRLYFDFLYLKRLLKVHKPDKVFSLQNKGFKTKKIPQDVYFHNALFICEKRFSFRESKALWLYQNPISLLTRKSLKYASRIFVQAEWIKSRLSEKWHISAEKIVVDRPAVHPIFFDSAERAEPATTPALFYPANYSAYKNHRVLFAACAALWDELGANSFSLLLSGTWDALPDSLKFFLDGKEYPVTFLGRLSLQEMRDTYLRSVLVFPSYIETVGLPLVEARTLSRPIIAADCEYARESIGQYENATYFPPFDPEALKQEICRVVGDNQK